MDDQELQELEKLRTQKEKQLKRQNNYIKNNYDRIGIALPKGQKAKIENRMQALGFKSITEYIKYLIDNDINNSGDFSGHPETNSYFDSGLPFG